VHHLVPVGFPERPERIAAVLTAIDEDRRFESIRPPARRSEDEVLAAVRGLHEGRYVERFRAAVERGDGLLDTADNPISRGSFGAALGAAAVALAAVDETMSSSRPVLACARPPGHHAERDRAMGFCFFNQAGIAAAHAIGLRRAPRQRHPAPVRRATGRALREPSSVPVLPRIRSGGGERPWRR
jgi:acetoin utilization deacetylase AcuC-like enzyme